MASPLTVYAESYDGYTDAYNNGTYATARESWGANVSLNSAGTDTGAMTLGQQKASTYYDIYEAFLSFDTSSIPDDATIDSVVLSLWSLTDNSSTDFVIQARTLDFGNTLTVGDHVAGTTFNGLTLLASRSTSGGFTTGGYRDLTSEVAFLSAINKTGKTRMVLCSDRFAAGTAPTQGETVVIDSSESSGNAARLVVAYTEAATSSYIVCRNGAGIGVGIGSGIA